MEVKTSVSPLKFQDPTAYFQVVFRSRRNLSLRAWSKRLGYRSHRTLGMVMSGERKASTELIRRLAAAENLTHQETQYLRDLIQKDLLKSDKEKLSLAADLKKAQDPLADIPELPEEAFQKIYDWYYFVIKQLVFVPSFKLDAAYLKSRLPKDFPIRKVKEALDTLLQLGLLQYDPETKKFSEVAEHLRTTHDVPSATLRRFQIQWLSQAAHSIQTHTVQERENLTLTFRGDRARMEEMKEFLRYMREEFAKKFHYEKSGEDVFQLLIHLFPATRHLEEKK